MSFRTGVQRSLKNVDEQVEKHSDFFDVFAKKAPSIREGVLFCASY
jgi:hypothetical protein